MATPQEILADALQRASTDIAAPIVNDEGIRERVELICRNIRNKALSRLILSCCLAKVHKPEVDIRKPYTEIDSNDAFSGRTYDEAYLGPFITVHSLPCNTTTAFLTPALRNRSETLTPSSNLVGRPPELYQAALQLLIDVHTGMVSAADLLAESIRVLLVVKNENQQRMETLLAGVKPLEGAIPLSAESIVSIVQSHLVGRNASRLPVLIVAAAYRSASTQIGEQAKVLASHNAADKQTGAIGDVEVTLINDEQVLTGYEMKMRRVTRDDIDLAVQKILDRGIENYIFITTEEISQEVNDYAKSLYEKTGGVEIAVLDCISFLRHFLHLFHRLRTRYIEEYQQLVLKEPDSAVSQPLKELWLSLRSAAESGLGSGEL
ncbi:MAG TPA: restriction endonuclease, SacI family [Abditibacteriaceae bacterium]|jgi:DNA adenine methylase